MFAGGWLFPGLDPINHMTARHLSRVCKETASVDIRVIQVLLGHAKLNTTALYTQVATDLLKNVISPFIASPLWKRR